METLNNIASWGLAIDETPRVRALQMGDGYEQRSKDGINNLVVGYDLSFSKRTEAEAKQIVDFLRARSGVESFFFRVNVLDGNKQIVICDKWATVCQEHNNYEVSATFRKDYSTFASLVPNVTFSVAGGNLTMFTSGLSYTTIYYTFSATGTPADPIPGRPGVIQYSAPITATPGNYKAVGTYFSRLDSPYGSHTIGSTSLSFASTPITFARTDVTFQSLTY